MTKTIILVAGLQRSGKSTFADTVEASGLGFTHVPLDDYIVPISPTNVSRRWVFDATLVDWRLLREHLQFLSAGECCYSPKPDWSNLGKRLSAGGPIESGPGRKMLPSSAGFVIPGIYAFAFPLDGYRIKRVYIETEERVLAERIAGRAVAPCDVAKTIETRVGSNVGTIAALKNQADLVVDGTLPPHAQIAQLTALLGVRLQIRKAFESAVERDTPAAMGSRMSQHREALPIILETLAARFERCAILVFGSVQRGAERPDSDLDLIVFYEGDGDLRVERDAKFPDVGVRVDVVLFPDAAFHRLAAKEWYLFWEFSQAEILHDPTGIARRNQDMIRRQLQSRPDIVSAWEELMAQVRRHKLDPSFEVPLTRPAFEDKLRRIYAGEMNGDRKPHPSKQAE